MGLQKLIGLNPNITHQEYVDAINAISTADNVKELLDHCRARVTFLFGSYHHIPAVGHYDYDRLNRYWSTGLDEAARRYFDTKGLKSDPIMKYVLLEARPFWLSSLLGKKEFSDGRSQHRINLALGHIGDGLLVPLFGPHNRRGYIYTGFENPREFYDEVFLWQVQSILQAVHIRYSKLIESLRATIKLTNREIEVVELISFGKTNPEIGIILGISSSTVAGHVKSVFLKFNATDRVTVALRAQSFSL